MQFYFPVGGFHLFKLVICYYEPPHKLATDCRKTSTCLTFPQRKQWWLQNWLNLHQSYSRKFTHAYIFASICLRFSTLWQSGCDQSDSVRPTKGCNTVFHHSIDQLCAQTFSPKIIYQELKWVPSHGPPDPHPSEAMKCSGCTKASLVTINVGKLLKL